jgi:hypothetical protein
VEVNMSTVILCGMPEEKEVLTKALPGLLVLSGTDKLNLPKLVPPDCKRIVSMGLCGGLAPSMPDIPLNVGSCVVASSVEDKGGLVSIPDTNWNSRAIKAAAAGKIVVSPVHYFSSGVLDQADSAVQRTALYGKYGAKAIDDETRYAAALVASRLLTSRNGDMSFNVLRAISDDWTETLPLAATGAILNKDGSVNISYLLWSLAQSGMSQNSAPGTSLFTIAVDFVKSLDALSTVASAVRGVLADDIPQTPASPAKPAPAAATQAQITAGAAALSAYLQSVDGWEARFIPASDLSEGAALIISAANKGPDQSALGRQAAGGAALFKAISAAGYGDKVTPAECRDAAGKVLAAI